MNHTIIKRGILAVCSAAVISTASFAAQTEAAGTQKFGLVTGISYSITDNNVTITAALGTMKEMPKPDKQEPPKQIKADDMVTLSGETVTFTLPADTALKFGMPPKNDSDDKALPPPPKDDKKAGKDFPALTVKSILVDNIITLLYDTDGKTVTGVETAVLPGFGMMKEKGRGEMKRPMDKENRRDMPSGRPDDDSQGPADDPQD
ncbi:MAG: hypothetical protein M0P01_08410 [Treponema sp.]|nr:hypothetical protein [Treponema sp.]